MTNMHIIAQLGSTKLKKPVSGCTYLEVTKYGSEQNKVSVTFRNYVTNFRKSIYLHFIVHA